jgi:hypothetical protein
MIGAVVVCSGLAATPALASSPAGGGTVSGTVTDASGHANTNVMVQLSGGPNDDRFSAWAPAGSFSFSGVADGTYTETTYNFPGAGDTNPVPTSLSKTVAVSGDTTANVVYPRTDTWTVSVLGTGGAPAPGSWVTAQPESDSLTAPDGSVVTLNLGMSPAVSCRTNASGECQLHEYDGLSVDTQTTTTTGLVSGTAPTFTVTQGATQTIHLLPTYTISGIARDGWGNPLPNLGIQAMNPTGSGAAYATTAYDGSYTITGVPQGTYKVGTRYASIPVVIAGGTIPADLTREDSSNAGFPLTADTTVNLSYPKTALVDVSVVDATGAPANNVVVTASVPGSDFADADGTNRVLTGGATQCTTDTTGHCNLTGFASANETFRLSPYYGADSESTVQVPAGGGTVALQLPPIYTLSGKVIAGTGDPTNGTVTVTGGPLGQSFTTSVASDGSYSFSALVAGTYSVTNDSKPFGAAGQTGDVQETRTGLTLSSNQTLDFSYPKLVPVNVAAVDAVGSPIQGALFTEQAHQTFTGDDGAPRTISFFQAPSCQTDANGTCFILGYQGLAEHLVLTPPGGGSASADKTIASGSDSVSFALGYYTSVPSSGSAAGNVTLSVPSGYTLTQATSQPVSQSSDASAILVGSMAYEVQGVPPGGEVDVTMTLPPGANPTAVYKVGANGAVTDATSGATITGNVVVMHLIDGGFGDEDGTANGVILDPLIPTGTAKLTASTARLPGGATGHAYSAQLAASGGKAPYTWSLTGGSLPSGLSLSSSGAITGTPTAVQSSPFTAQVKDSAGHTANGSFDIAVSTVAVATQGLPLAYAGAAYSTPLKAVGGSGSYTWSLASGSLPTGLSLASNGTISGTPPTSGGAAFTVRARDTHGNVALESLTLGVRPMTISTWALTHGVAGKAYPSTALKVLGGKATYSWSISSGALPPGLSLSASGVLSGTPVGPGEASFTVRVTDGSLPKRVATHTYIMWIAPMTVATSTLPNAKVKALYSQSLKANGGKATLVWSLASGSLPPGLHLGAGGAITGTPTTAGTYAFTVRVADGSTPKNVATAKLSITVA